MFSLCFALSFAQGIREFSALAEIAAAAVRELDIVTPSNCVAVMATQKEVASVGVACWKPKLRCGIKPQTKIRNVQQSSHPHYSDNVLFAWWLQLGSSIDLHWSADTDALNGSTSLLPAAFPTWRDFASPHESCCVTSNPWIVLVAIYTTHSDKQEAFWMQWTYSARTIPEGRVISCTFSCWLRVCMGPTEIPLRKNGCKGQSLIYLAVIQKERTLGRVYSFFIFIFFKLCKLLWNGAIFTRQSLGVTWLSAPLLSNHPHRVALLNCSCSWLSHVVISDHQMLLCNTNNSKDEKCVLNTISSASLTSLDNLVICVLWSWGPCFFALLHHFPTDLHNSTVGLVCSHLPLCSRNSRVIRPRPGFQILSSRGSLRPRDGLLMSCVVCQSPSGSFIPAIISSHPLLRLNSISIHSSLTSCKDVISDAVQRLGLIKGRDIANVV